jgi:hypothetical protein
LGEEITDAKNYWSNHGLFFIFFIFIYLSDILILPKFYSADLWIPSSSCPITECPYGSFDQSSSSTFKSLDESFQISYGIGSVNGTYATDTVTIGGASVQNQQFGLATTTQQILTNQNTISVSAKTNVVGNTTLHASAATSQSDTITANGILGLGYPKLTAAYGTKAGAYNPFVFNLVSQNIISDPVFSIYMNTQEKTGWSGEIIFGGVDSSKYTGDIVYMPVVSISSASPLKKRAGATSSNNYYWMVSAQGVGIVGGAQESFSSSSAFIFDTGTTLTYLPQSLAADIIGSAFDANSYTLDSSSGTYIVDCSTGSSSTKQFELLMKSSNSSDPITLTIPVSELLLPLDGDTVENSNYCLFGIAPLSSGSGAGSNLYLVGDSVLRSAYLVFDIGNSRIGIAPATGVQGSVQGVSASASSAGSIINPSSMVALLSCLFVAALSY